MRRRGGESWKTCELFQQRLIFAERRHSMGLPTRDPARRAAVAGRGLAKAVYIIRRIYIYI